MLLTGAHGVAPASDLAHCASGGAGGGEGHGHHALVEDGGLAQLDQHDVVVDVVGAVLGMADDARGADILLASLVDPEVVLSKTHLNAAGGGEGGVSRGLVAAAVHKSKLNTYLHRVPLTTCSSEQRTQPSSR